MSNIGVFGQYLTGEKLWNRRCVRLYDVECVDFLVFKAFVGYDVFQILI